MLGRRGRDEPGRVLLFTTRIRGRLLVNLPNCALSLMLTPHDCNSSSHPGILNCGSAEAGSSFLCGLWGRVAELVLERRGCTRRSREVLVGVRSVRVEPALVGAPRRILCAIILPEHLGR